MNETKTEIALNLRPGDEVESDGNWWKVSRHSVDLCDPAGVRLDLESEFDYMLMTIAVSPFQRFNYRPR